MTTNGSVIVTWGAKGGSGTSVLAAACALVLARRGGARLVDLGGDQPAILGVARCEGPGVTEWLLTGADAHAGGLDRLTTEAAPDLALVRRGAAPLPDAEEAGRRLVTALAAGAVPSVVDAGPAGPELLAGLSDPSLVASVMVTRACYLSLRRVALDTRYPPPDGVVVVEEAGRALRARDVDAVLGVPVVTTVPASRDIGRAVDAGTLPVRMPTPLARAARTVCAVVPPATTGEVAA